VLLGLPSIANASSAAASPISIRLVLRHTTVFAGHVLNGDAIITNHSTKTVVVEACVENGWLDVGLSNTSYTYSPTTVMVICPPTIRLRPGVNHFPIAVSTKYQVCTKSTPDTNIPKCARNGMPNLPKGQYHTSVILNGLPKNTRDPSNIKVTIR
jgi:hypothetical protein